MPVVPKPAPRLVRTWQDAEDYVAEYVQWLGWEDAQSTRRTSDEGIDVISRSKIRGALVAQVKMEGKPVESKVVRDLRGSGSVVDAQHHLVFALAGFKPPAIDWANRAQVALFEFAYDGSVAPVNDLAEQMETAGGGQLVTKRATKVATAPSTTKRPTGPIGELRPEDLKFLSAVEQWEKADRSHLDGYAFGGLGGENADFIARRIGLPDGYATAAYPDLRRYINANVVYRDKVFNDISYIVLGLKPYGVKALREWGVPLQNWRC